MKVFIFLLVLANLLFYAFGAGYFGRPDNPDAGRVEQQVAPDRIRIVSRGEAPATPAVRTELVTPEIAPAEEPSVPEKAEADKPVAPEPEPVAKADRTPACLSWRPLPVAEADRLSSLLAKRFSDYKVTRKLIASEGNGWWVFVPPLPNKGEADKKSAELRELGVTDFFVVQDAQNRFAISLGVFSTEKGGQDRLAELKTKGVRSAQVAPRPGKENLVSLQARGPASEKTLLLGAVGQTLPKAEALACK
ncbi:MAG: SPOR domain-containing protein [Dechloromonas sp.]|nr:SPOR domain-containing protein [Dechloromonas sp.]